MRKTVYIFCVCLLCVMAYVEIRHNRSLGSNEYVATAQFASQVRKENESRAGGGKVAYLTFDDGPSANTEKILDIMGEKEVVATFFLVGREITPEREDIVKRIRTQGNAVGVHTYCHKKNQIYSNVDSFFEDFRMASDRIEEVTGEKPRLHRFPWGSNNGYVSSYVDALHERLREMGVRSFDWNVSGEDSLGGTVAQNTIFNNVKRDLARYEEPIILLHDSATMDNTAAVLGRLIDYIRAQGYSFATLEKRQEYMFPTRWRH